MIRRLSIGLGCTAILAMGLLFGNIRPALGDSPTTGPSAISQSRPGGMDPVRMVQRVRDAIGQLSDLTDDQKTQLNAILDKADAQAKDLADRIQDLQARQKSFNQDLRQQLTGLLDDQQMQALAQKLNMGHPGGRMLDVFKEEVAKLDLTDDQKKQISDLISETTKKVDDLHASGAQGDDLRQQGQAIFQDFRQQIQQILSDDQQKQLQEAMQARFQAMRDAAGGASPDNATTRPSQPAN